MPTMTDEELDRDWQPNGRRPQSTVARSFSDELMNIFRIENSVADLDAQVNKRKHHVSTKASELHALEARLKEMEAMLKGGGHAVPSADDGSSGTPSHARQALEGTLPTNTTTDAPAAEDASRPPQQPADAQKHAGSRPGTARASQQAVPGALPPTPIGSEGE